MYNRYIGNTGKYERVDDTPHVERHEVYHQPPVHEEEMPPKPESLPHKTQGKKGILSDLGSLFGNFGGLFKGGGGDGFLKSLLPKNMDTGDILVLLVLLFLYLESKDEEILIILIAMFVLK